MKRLLMALLLVCIATGSALAQSNDSSPRTARRALKSYNIFFDINSSDVVATFKSNSHTLKQLKADGEFTIQNAKMLPDTVFIYATASPDGPHSFNQTLARQRALSTKAAFLEMFSEFSDSQFVVEYQVEDWDGLRQVLLSDPSFPQRDQMLRILDSNPQGNIHAALKDCAEGWNYFVENHIHALRNSSVTLTLLTQSPEDEFVRAVSSVVQTSQAVVANATTAPAPALRTLPATVPAQSAKKMIMAARTNLLVPGMSIGLEFPIKDNWSIGLDYYYPWILPKSNKWCVETIGGFVEVRYWFPGSKYQWTDTQRLQGHSIGLYGGVGYYDYQMVADGLQGEYVDLGVDYTYALPVAKGKLRMEFNIGLGLVRSWYRPYYMSSDYEDLIKEPGILYNTTNFFGPTRAGVSLVVPIVVKTKATRK